MTFGLEPITPAYGRDYKNIEEVLMHFNENKDFRAANGQYVNKLDLVSFGHKKIRVRFNDLQDTEIIEIK